jgi:hypothetical protein
MKAAERLGICVGSAMSLVRRGILPATQIVPGSPWLVPLDALASEHAAPLVAGLEAWLRCERARLSRHNDVAKAMDYLLKRWPAFTRFLDDGKICLTHARCAVSPSADAAGCSRVPIAVVSGRPRSTR